MSYFQCLHAKNKIKISMTTCKSNIKYYDILSQQFSVIKTVLYYTCICALYH